jgi:SAM-dependent methyltransferase
VSSFDAEQYWSQRLGESFSLGGVGWLTLTEQFNRWMYRVRRRVFLRVLRPLLEECPDTAVLDVGSGTGFYVDLWHELGASSVTGSDITGIAVERLRDAHPEDEFIQLDVGDRDAQLRDAGFDMVSAMDVLFHIVDDARYDEAFRNLARALKPGGYLVLSENLLHGATQRAEHHVSRSLEQTRAAAEAAGLTPVIRRPMFVLMNTPVDSPRRGAIRYWELLTSIVRRGPRVANVVGMALFPIELFLTRVCREGPSTEIMVCRKQSGPGTSSGSGGD